MRDPPVFAGESHERLMQSLNALTTLGGAGGPGKAEECTKEKKNNCPG